MSQMDEVVGIMVTRPIYDQFHTLLLQSQSTADELMNHFFALNEKNERKNASTTQKPLAKGSNFRKLTVNIPKNVLLRDISVNVALPDGCQSSDDGESSGDSPEGGMLTNRYVSSPQHLSTVQHHWGRSKRERVLNCNICSFKTNGRKKLQNHLRNHARRQYKCSWCHVSFVNDSKLKQHVRLKHGNFKSGVTSNEGSELSHSPSTTNQTSHDTGNDCFGKNENVSQQRELILDGGQEVVVARDNTDASGLSQQRLNSIFEPRASSSISVRNFTRYKCICMRRFCSISRLLHHKKFCKLSISSHKRKICKLSKIRQKLKDEKPSYHASNHITEMECQTKLPSSDRMAKVSSVGFGKKCDFSTRDIHETFKCDNPTIHNIHDIQQMDINSSINLIKLNTAHEQGAMFIEHSKMSELDTSSAETNGEEFETSAGLNLHNERTEMFSDTQSSGQKHSNELSIHEVDQCQNEAHLLLSFSRSVNQPSDNVYNADTRNPENYHESFVDKDGDQNGDIAIGHDNVIQNDVMIPLDREGSQNKESNSDHHHDGFLNSEDRETLNVESNHINIKQENIEMEESYVQNNATQMTDEEQFFMNFAQEVSKRYAEENPNFENFYMGRGSAGSFQEEGEGILKCEECGEIFKRKAYLKEHIEGKHGGGLRYSCDCGKKFKWRSSLGNHRKSCQLALTASCSDEGQSLGQNVSVIDFSQYNPYLGLENNWANEIERLKHSVLFAKRPEMNSSVDKNVSNVSHEGKSALNVPKMAEQYLHDQSKQEQTSCQNSLRIDSSLVKPFADALSKYKQKQTTSICQSLSSNNKVSSKSSISEMESDKAVIDLTMNLTSKSSEVNSLSGEKVHSRIRNEEVTHESLHHGRKSNIPGGDQLKEEQCSFCNEAFINKSELERHKLFCKHLQDTCSVCGQRFQHRKDLVNHLLTFHGNDESYNCFCGFQSSTWALFEKHCEKCDEFKKKSASLLSLDKNLSQFRNKSVVKEPVLTGMQNKPRVRRHSDMTDTRLSSNSDLATNMSLIHHGLIPTSSELTQNFHQRHSSQQVVSPNVQDHGRQSTALPTFSSFVSSSANLLNNTKLSTSTGSNISTNQNSLLNPGSLNRAKLPPDSSRVLEKEFVSKSDVYVCSFCGNVFNDLQKFAEHNKLHLCKKSPNNNQSQLLKSAVDMAINKSRQQPVRVAEHVCHLCGDVFAAKAYLKEHIGGKHGTIDRYKCPCGMRFKWRSSLGIHQRKCPKACRRTYNRWNSS